MIVSLNMIFIYKKKEVSHCLDFIHHILFSDEFVLSILFQDILDAGL